MKKKKYALLIFPLKEKNFSRLLTKKKLLSLLVFEIIFLIVVFFIIRLN